MTKSAKTPDELPKIIAKIIKPIIVANLYNWRISNENESPINEKLIHPKTNVIAKSIKDAIGALENSSVDATEKEWIQATFVDLFAIKSYGSFQSFEILSSNNKVRTMSSICDLKNRVAKQFWDKKLSQEDLANFAVKYFGGIRFFEYDEEYDQSLNSQLKQLAPGSLRNKDPLPSITKIFSFAYPDQCFIYDSRVSIALNAIIEKHQIKSCENT